MDMNVEDIDHLFNEIDINDDLDENNNENQNTKQVYIFYMKLILSWIVHITLTWQQWVRWCPMKPSAEQAD